MDLSQELYDDAWNQICFAQKKIDDARRALRDAGAPSDAPALKLTEDALRNLSEANRAVVHLQFPKKEDKKMKRTCENCRHACPTNMVSMIFCFRDKDRSPRKLRTPACKDFELACNKLDEVFQDALRKNREEHPSFVPPPQKNRSHIYALDAQTCRGYIKEGLAEIPSEDEENALGGYRFDLLRNVLFAEAYDFLVKAADRNFDGALEKAGRIVAVIYRALNGDGEKKEANE